MRTSRVGLLLLLSLPSSSCRSLQRSSVKDDATKRIEESMPGGLVRTTVAKDKILDYIIPADGSNGVPPSMNGIWWTNARSVAFVVSFRNAVWDAAKHRATILMTGPYTYSTPSHTGKTDVDDVSNVPISRSYAGYDIEFNAAGDFGNLLVASSDRNGDRHVSDAGYTMVYAQDGDWVRKTVGSDDYHIRRIFNADGTKNPIIYQMKVRQGRQMVDFTGTAFDGYMKDDGMGDFINVNLPVNAIAASGGSVQVAVDPAAPRTYVAISGGKSDLRGIVTVSPSFQGTLYVQNAKGEWVSGKSSDVKPGGVVPAVTDGDGKAFSITADLGTQGLIALRSPSESNEVVQVSFTPIPVLTLDERHPIANLQLLPGGPDQRIRVVPADLPAGYYQISTSGALILEASGGEYYETGKTMQTPAGGGAMTVTFSSSRRIDLKVSLPPGSQGGRFDLKLTPLPPPVITNKGLLPAAGTAITGTLSAIDGVDVYDLGGLLSPSVYQFDLTPNLGPDLCCFDVIALRSDRDLIEQLFAQPLRSSWLKKSLYMWAETNKQIAVTYAGPLDVAAPRLDYSFVLTPHNQNSLPDPIIHTGQKVAPGPVETE